MTTTAISATPSTSAGPNPSPHKRGQPLLAWLVILGVVGFILWRQAVKPAPDEYSRLVPMQMQSRYLVGVNSMKFPGATGESLYEQAESSLDAKGYSERLRLAVLAGELVGPEKAGAVLRDLETKREEGATDAKEAAVETG